MCGDVSVWSQSGEGAGTGNSTTNSSATALELSSSGSRQKPKLPVIHEASVAAVSVRFVEHLWISVEGAGQQQQVPVGHPGTSSTLSTDRLESPRQEALGPCGVSVSSRTW